MTAIKLKPEHTAAFVALADVATGLDHAVMTFLNQAQQRHTAHVAAVREHWDRIKDHYGIEGDWRFEDGKLVPPLPQADMRKYEQQAGAVAAMTDSERGLNTGEADGRVPYFTDKVPPSVTAQDEGNTSDVYKTDEERAEHNAWTRDITSVHTPDGGIPAPAPNAWSPPGAAVQPEDTQSPASLPGVDGR